MTPRRTIGSPRARPALGGANEKWHIHGGTDLLISGLIERLPHGTVHLGEKLVALRTSTNRGYVCTFESDGTTHDVNADHVVLALPFTTLRLVDLKVSPRRSHRFTCAQSGRATRHQLEVLRPVQDEGVEHRPRDG